MIAKARGRVPGQAKPTKTGLAEAYHLMGFLPAFKHGRPSQATAVLIVPPSCRLVLGDVRGTGRRPGGFSGTTREIVVKF